MGKEVSWIKEESYTHFNVDWSLIILNNTIDATMLPSVHIRASHFDAFETKI